MDSSTLQQANNSLHRQCFQLAMSLKTHHQGVSARGISFAANASMIGDTTGVSSPPQSHRRADDRGPRPFGQRQIRHQSSGKVVRSLLDSEELSRRIATDRENSTIMETLVRQVRS